MAAAHKAAAREGLDCGVVRAIRSISLAASLVVYTISPSWLGELSVPLPDWVRHPIYLALMSFTTSSAPITATWLFIALFWFSIVDLALRIPKEEQMMIAKCGDEYEACKPRTGRLLPK